MSPGGRALRVVAIELDSVLGDTRSLWRDWLVDAERRLRLDGLELPDDRAAAAAELDARLGNWRQLLARFAEERAPVYLRPDGGVNAALRRLKAAGTRIEVVTDAPEELARVALAQLGAARYVDAIVPEAPKVVRSRADLP